MPAKKSAAEECCAKCEKDVAALRKEIATLKREITKKSAGGSDSKVDVLISAIKNYHPRWRKVLEKAGL